MRSEGGAARVASASAECPFDTQQLIVLRRPFAAASAAGLDLAGVGRDRDVGNRRILGFT